MNLPLEIFYQIYYFLPSKDLAKIKDVLPYVNFYIIDYKLEKDMIRYDVKEFSMKWEQYYTKHMDEIVKNGCSLEVLEWMKDNGFPYDYWTKQILIKFGLLKD